MSLDLQGVDFGFDFSREEIMTMSQKAMWSEDGVHPSKSGYEALGELTAVRILTRSRGWREVALALDEQLEARWRSFYRQFLSLAFEL